MLAFDRKINEGVKIGDDIEMRILDIKQKQSKFDAEITLGFKAPNNIKILRRENVAMDSPLAGESIVKIQSKTVLPATS